MTDGLRRFQAVLQPGPRGGAFVRLPFGPADAWGARDRYHVRGRIGGLGVRGALLEQDGGFVLPVGPAWLRGCSIRPGTELTIELEPEGIQLDDLDDDVAEALRAEPEAARFFEALAQFYRTAYLKWLDGAKRRPAVRQERLSAFVELLKAGRKSR
jgi:hypothetical protein